MATPAAAPAAAAVPAPERFIVFDHILLHPAPIGCTAFHRAFDVAQQPPQPVFAWHIPPSDRERFVQTEGPVLFMLSGSPHPHLARVVASTEDAAGGVTVAFRPCYSDLHTHVRMHGALGEARARTLFAQLLQAVAHCHARQVCLRDIKLGKMMFADRACTSLVLADLTGAQTVAPGTLLTDKRGSPAYVAPEVLAAPAYDGFAADMWSLGVVLYVLLTGHYPFQATAPAELFALITSGAPPPIPDTLSPAAARVLAALLHRDPAQRPTAAALLADDPWLQLEPQQTAAAAAAADEEEEQEHAAAAAAAAADPPPPPHRN